LRAGAGRWITPRAGDLTGITYPSGTGNLNTTNYSWGPGGWDSHASAAEYIQRQTEGIHRDGRGIILRLSPAEEIKPAACLRRDRGAYNGVTNNCGNPWLTCLKELGVVDTKNKSTVLPNDVYNIIANSPRAVGQTTYTDIGNKSFAISPAWPVVDGIRRATGGRP